MAWLEICGELRFTSNFVHWEPMFILYCRSLGVRHVPSKMAEFMREIQAKDKETVEKLRILQREMELNARDSSVNKALLAVFVIVSSAGSGVPEDWVSVMPGPAPSDAGSVIGVPGVVGSGVTVLTEVIMVLSETTCRMLTLGLHILLPVKTLAFGVKKVIDIVPDWSAIHALKLYL
ncbi:hypothetical protein Tco_1239557 [Tanacetum coccineum]